jgi:hypothetical protein
VPARFQVLFDGQPAADAFYQSVTSVEVEENADLPGAIQVTLPIASSGAAGAEDLTVIGDDAWKPYGRIAVVATPDGGTDACIFDGHVLSQKVHLDRGTTASSVRVWGQDVTCMMNLEEVVKPWTKKDGEIANEIFDKYSFAKASGNLSDDSPAHPEDKHTVMQRATDAQFLRDRARRNGKLFRICCDRTAGQNTGYFVKPDLDASPDATLVINPPGSANVDTLDFEWDVARPTKVLAQVLLASKDPDKGDTEASGLSLLDSRSLAALVGDSHAMQARLTTATGSVDELKQRAASLLREAGWFVKCEGETDLARLGKVLRVARVVQVDGAGQIHSGKYFVWSVRHTITSESHRMKFTLVRNAVGSS